MEWWLKGYRVSVWDDGKSLKRIYFLLQLFFQQDHFSRIFWVRSFLFEDGEWIGGGGQIKEKWVSGVMRLRNDNVLKIPAEEINLREIKIDQTWWLLDLRKVWEEEPKQILRFLAWPGAEWLLLAGFIIQVLISSYSSHFQKLFASNEETGNDWKIPLGSSHCGTVETNPTSIHEDVGSFPGLAQCLKDLVLPWAVV